MIDLASQANKQDHLRPIQRKLPLALQQPSWHGTILFYVFLRRVSEVGLTVIQMQAYTKQGQLIATIVEEKGWIATIDPDRYFISRSLDWTDLHNLPVGNPSSLLETIPLVPLGLFIPKVRY